ncbi:MULTISPECIES: hypothetical protein [unclassified Pseudoalteromonas]|uniref:hypothetical protein n=1 Tax=unclassified Pseudoalteromonas TaxID=194690 RepID=UPI00042091F6|nr:MULTISPECIES: hypothetical protein [unclassified Pseudoalteromonas]PCC14216.1 hypothetical protein CIK86_13740 [Pseudoalteromonas sp. JB197]SJN16343.1 hypothetical protein CZ797_00400 [Pseudoalteromonas sp. JB197]
MNIFTIINHHFSKTLTVVATTCALNMLVSQTAVAATATSAQMNTPTTCGVNSTCNLFTSKTRTDTRTKTDDSDSFTFPVPLICSDFPRCAQEH